MKKEKILNIVFIKDEHSRNTITSAWIFKKDCEPLQVTTYVGEQAFLELKRQRKIKKDLNDIINKKYVYKLSESQLNEYSDHFAKSTRNPLPEHKKEIGKRIGAVLLAAVVVYPIMKITQSLVDKYKEKETTTTSQSQDLEETTTKEETTKEETTTKEEKTTTKNNNSNNSYTTTSPQYYYSNNNYSNYIPSTQTPSTQAPSSEEYQAPYQDDYNDYNNSNDYYEYEEPWINDSNDNNDTDNVYSNDPLLVEKERIADFIIEEMSKSNEEKTVVNIKKIPKFSNEVQQVDI